MLNIYLIRHGETDYNRLNIVQGGGVDSDLNDTGRQQAQRFWEHYGHLHFDKIYCTELKRTRQTLKGFADSGREVQALAAFNEFNWGILEGAEASEEVRRTFDEVTGAWRSGALETRVPMGESPLEAWERAQPGVKQVLEEAPPGGRVLICSHGRIMRVVLSQLLGYGLQHMELFPHQNTALNHLVWLPSGHFRLHRINDTRHLQ